MPCTYTGSLAGDRVHHAEESSKTARSELDRITSYLCAVCNYLEFTEGGTGALTTLEDAATNSHLPFYAIQDWWSAHKLDDLKKEQEDNAVAEERAAKIKEYSRLKKELGL